MAREIDPQRLILMYDECRTALEKILGLTEMGKLASVPEIMELCLLISSNALASCEEMADQLVELTEVPIATSDVSPIQGQPQQTCTRPIELP